MDNDVRTALIRELLASEVAGAKATIRRMERIKTLLGDYDPSDARAMEVRRYEDGDQPALLPKGWKVSYGS